MAKDFSDISAEEASDAQQKALEIEARKKSAQKQRISKKRKKRQPKDALPPIKERLVAPFLLVITLLFSWLIWWLGTR